MKIHRKPSQLTKRHGSYHNKLTGFKVILSSLLLILIFGCGDSRSKLDPVPDYVLKDTDEVLAEVSDEISGLDIENFFQAAFYSLVDRGGRHVWSIENPEQWQRLAVKVKKKRSDDSVELQNISDEFYEQLDEVYAFILEKLLEYDRESLSTNDKITYDIFRTFLEFRIEWGTFRKFEYPASYGFFGHPGATLSYFTESFEIIDQSSAEDYLVLLNQIGRRFDQVETLLEKRRSQGVVEPSLTLSYSLSQVDRIKKQAAEETPYYQRFEAALESLTDIDSKTKQKLMKRLLLTVNKRVLPAYKSLSKKMGEILVSAPSQIGFGQFSGGKAFYEFTLRYYTSSNNTVDEIHELGLQELARIHNEMRAYFDQLGYPSDESIAQLYLRAEIDGGVVESENVVGLYEDFIAEAYTRLPEAFSTLPVQEVIVVGGVSGGYYMRGTANTPGRFFASNVYDIPYTTMRTLAYHEAIPGHHLQLALVAESDLPTLRREIGFTSFIEGWALYAERLASDLGWYEGDIYGELGRLQYEAMRAARLVVDTGIHHKGWSYDDANQFHIDNVGYEGSIFRYSIYPGQATAYMTGMLKILELRERAQTELGDSYDIKDFHRVVIGNGSVPLGILEQVVDNYINEMKRQ